MKKTAISSVVCVDIIDFSKKSETEQQEMKLQLTARINHAIFDIPESDRVVVETEQGAIVSCSGPLESALEDALFIALTIRDEVLNKNTDNKLPLYLLMAINLGSVRPSTNKTNTKIQGEGLFEAQQIMRFGNPNQILVSREYYDMASKLTLEVAQMFEKYDMHAYEHDIYAVRRLNEKSVVENAAAALDHLEKPQEEDPVASTFRWQVYFLPALLALIMLIVLFKWMQHDRVESTGNEVSIELPSVEDAVSYDVDILPDPLPEITIDSEGEETLEKPASEASASVQTKKQTKKPKQKPVTEKTQVTEEVATEQVIEAAADEVPGEDNANEEKSTWDAIKDSVKTGTDQPCSQAQRALNQCN